MQKASMVELQICMSEEMQGISQSPSLLLSPSPSLACYSSGNSTLAEIAARVAHEMSLQEDGLEGDVGFDTEELFHQSETELPRLDEEDEETADAEDRGDKGDEFEFAFVCGAPESAPISADEIFHNGKIRPMYDYSPVTYSGEEYEKQRRPRRPQLKLLMSEEPPETGFSCSSSESDELDGAAPGTYCVWIPREHCRKSSSTGSGGSRRWKLKHLLLNRSNSDGSTSDVVSVMPPRKAQGNDAAAGDGGKAGGSPDGGRRWSYLPHRTNVVGFFANVNGLNRKLHPFK